MQWEQATNFEQFVRHSIGNPSFSDASRQIKTEINATNGRQITGNLIWDLIEQQSTRIEFSLSSDILGGTT